MGSVNAIPGALWLAATQGPQVDTPTQAAAKNLQLQNAREEQQLRQQQLQSGQIALQQQQQDYRDQQTIRQLYMNSGGDLDKVEQGAMKAGVGPKTLFGLRQQRLAMQKEMAALDETQLKNEASRHDALRGELDAFMGKDDDAKAQEWQPWIQQHIASGRLTQKEGAQLLQQHPAYPGNDQMKLYANGLATGSQLAKEETERRTAAARETTNKIRQDELNMKAPGLKAEAEGKVRADAAAQLGSAKDQASYALIWGDLPAKVARIFPTPEQFNPAQTPGIVRQIGMTAEQQTQATQAALNEQNLQGYRKQELAQGAARVSLEQKRYNATLGAGLDANGQPISPEAMKAAALQDPNAVAIANYQIPPPAGRTSPLGMATMRKVLAIDPNYDAMQFPMRNKTAQDFSASGKTGQVLTSADIALSHLDTLSKAGAALKNTDIPALNRIALAVGAQVGSTPKTTYDTILSMVAPEISKAVIGAAGGEGERVGMAQNFSSSMSPDQREQAIGAAVNLLKARFDKQAHAYEETMGKPLARSLSPESQAVAARYSGAPAPQKGGAPATAAPQFKAGDTRVINGTTYKRDAKGNWNPQ